MNTDINKNNISSNELQIHISYVESVLENYIKQLTDIQKSDADFSKHFIPDGQLDELKDYLNQLEKLEKGITSLLPKIASEMSLKPSYEYVTSMRNCLSGSIPEAIRLLAFLAGKYSYSIEQKLMASMELNGKRLVEVTDAYDKERNILSNKAVDKAKFLRESELIKLKKNVYSNKKITSTIKQDNDTVSSGPSIRSDVTVGDTITFGKYHQEKDGAVKPIEWSVLEKKDSKILVISKYALDDCPYNAKEEHVTWETSTLRKWLNDKFYSRAFSIEEQSRIALTSVVAEKNLKWINNDGKDTEDRVFLLSIKEVEQYFSSNKVRECTPTAYAIERGARLADGKPICVWWLRSSGELGTLAMTVRGDGSIHKGGSYVNYSRCIRPALWINL